jgi:hypothetical protein
MVELAMKRKTLNRAIAAAAFLLTGFVGGNVLADVAGDSLKNTTLFEAMRHVHGQTTVDIVWRGADSAKRPVAVAAGAAPVTVSQAAKPFGRDAVLVSGVFVLDPALPDAQSGIDRLHALKAYLKDALPDGDRDVLTPFSQATNAQAKALHAGLPLTTQPFSQLSPAQQQGALDALRASQLGDAVSGLDYLVQH